MEIIKKLLILPLLLGLIISFAIIACSDDSENPSECLNLSPLSSSVKIGDYLSANLSLNQEDRVQKIVIKKTIDGKAIASYQRELNVKDLTFPYTFKEEIIAGDETGVLVYSFYGLDASGQQVDASDIVVSVELAQLPLFLKYDWGLLSQQIQGSDFAEVYMKDDVYRFNPDMSWELDWGDIKSAGALETLDSYCAWKAITTGATVDSLYMIKYNIFSPKSPVVTKYKVLKLENREMILESRQDLSFLPGFAKDEKVTDKFQPISKSDDFTPYRGANSDSYFVESCNPGSY